ALYATLPAYDALRRRLPALLRASLPRGLLRHPRRRRYPLIIDLHRVPYYKRGRTPPRHVRKGQRLAGTRYAHDYATASLLRKGQYYVVAVTPYDPGESLADVTRLAARTRGYPWVRRSAPPQRATSGSSEPIDCSGVPTPATIRSGCSPGFA